jgi:glycosyltransferase involved in cell wall biosynthesis
MAAGTPVVAANAGALPETCAGAAVLAEPEGEAFAAALTALVADESERARLRAAGLERAAGFSWDATARAVDALLFSRGGAAPGRSPQTPAAPVR